MSYRPPFEITAKAINLISEISAQLERFSIAMEQGDSVQLRKINRMKTIHGTLAIEGNSLSEEQVTALIEGKPVIAPLREVQEVRNAILAYGQFMKFDPYNVEELLKAHGIFAWGLVDNPGHFRKGGVCVMGKDGIRHVAPPAHRVPFLISDLFDWVKKSEDHILIKSSVFHYEFEFIHPFPDGNGRMGRFWQSRLLAEWNPVFEYIPVENMIRENQADYYKAIERSTDENDSGIFAEFMLQTILDTIKKHKKKVTAKVTVKVTANQQKIISAINENPYITQEELSKKVGIAIKNIKENMKKLQEQGIIRRIGADKNGHWEIVK
ncbi:Fic family protein [bacterium]|nr:Fic family protein [bacterium]